MEEEAEAEPPPPATRRPPRRRRGLWRCSPLRDRPPTAAAAAAAAAAMATVPVTLGGGEGHRGDLRPLFDRDDDGLWVLSDWDAHQTALGEESFTSQGGGMGDICGMLGVPPQETTGRRGRGEGKGERGSGDGAGRAAALLRNRRRQRRGGRPREAHAPHAEDHRVCRRQRCHRCRQRGRGDAALLPPVRVLAVGAAVEARFRGGPKYFPGTVLGVFCDGEHVDVGADSSARRGPRTGQPCSRRSATTFASTTATRRKA